MFEIMCNMKYAQTDDYKINKAGIFTKLDEVRKLIDDNIKIPQGEKKQLYMQINNTKKNICYHRGEKDEACKLLQDQLALIGDNEATYGISMTHIF